MTTENYQIDLTTCFYPERTYIISLPAKFASDHMDRELPSGELKFRTRNGWTFECTVPELKEWLSDAEYYADRGIYQSMGHDFYGLHLSAISTVKYIRSLMTTMGIN